MTTDVDTIVRTDAFNTWYGGLVTTGPMKLAPDEWQGDAKPALQYGLDRILDSLRSRVPPIEFSDLADPTELIRGIYYAAAEHLHTLAMTSGQLGDLHFEQRRHWAEEFTGWITGYAPTLAGGLRGPSALTIAVSRR